MAQQIPNDPEPSKPFLFLHMTSVEKLHGANFQQWRVQIESLLLGYGLHGYITGDNSLPPTTLITNSSDSESKSVNTETPNPAYLTWFRQDKLVYGALAITLGPSIGPLIIRCTTAKEAWDGIYFGLRQALSWPSESPTTQIQNFEEGNHPYTYLYEPT
ncbi:hypothetical protein vseg_000812 [Gypsophila vaccaria]